VAATQLGTQLTQLHYRQQVAARADVLRQLVQVFPALDVSSFDAVDRSWPALERALELIIGQGHATSAGLSINYYELLRAAEGVGGSSTALLAETLPAEQVATSLRVTGPYTAKHLIATKSPQVAQTTFAILSGAVTRLSSNGGRGTLDRSVRADRRALGWARVTSGRACSFCRLLRSRGAVYKEESSKFQAHDHCSCTSEPIWSKDQPLPPGSAEDAELYRQITAGLKGKDALNAFRRAVEGGE
jgi:hypothetical protein